MEKILILIKHHFRFVWKIIEWFNNLLFCYLHATSLERILPGVFAEFMLSGFSFRRLNLGDAQSLHTLITTQNIEDMEYFKPHGFDIESIRRQFQFNSFLMMGAFSDQRLIGYFFLRFFSNSKCFVGRIIDKDFRGKGIGLVMNKIMYEIAWRMSFQCLSTISKHNNAIIKAHKKNSNMRIIKALHDDYLLVEFLKTPS
jgi:RimJ/RimL family protein N-acetyltransferase